MKALARHRAEACWAALLLLVPAAALWGPRGSVADTNTWSTSPRGKKVFFTLLQQTVPDVVRQPGRLLPPPGAGTLCVLGPARLPDDGEWEKLRAWVSAGHLLVFAAREDDPAGDLGAFGLRLRPERVSATAEDAAKGLDIDEALPRPGKPMAWRGSAWIEGARSDAWVGARFRGLPVIVAQPVGRGMVVAIASDEIFDNVSMLDPGRALLAYRLLERVRPPGALVFDESLNESGPPRVVGLLLGAPLRALTFQLVALALVFGWMGARRFGPRVTAEPEARRFMTEHAQALGHLCHEAGAGPSLVSSYLEYFRRDLGLRPGAQGEKLSRAAGKHAAAAKSALAEATRIAAFGRGSNQEAAAAVGELARVKQRIRQL